MGFSIQDVVILYGLKYHNFLKTGDSVIEIGSQQINNDIIENLESLEGLAKLFGVVPFHKTFEWKIRNQKFLESGMQELPNDAPLAQNIYEHLGLKYACIDINANPRSIRMDLNFDPVSKEYKGKYSLTTNLGTTEHVINQLNAFKIIHDLTAPGGVMVHTLPFQGFATHGLVNYTMKFFWLLCRSNRYRVIDTDISACQRIPISNDIVDFAKKEPLIFIKKDHIEKLEMQDTGITIILQKVHNMDFVPPIDVPDGTEIREPDIKKRYWTEFDRNSLKMLMLRGKSFFKKIFRC